MLRLDAFTFFVDLDCPPFLPLQDTHTRRPPQTLHFISGLLSAGLTGGRRAGAVSTLDRLQSGQSRLHRLVPKILPDAENRSLA